MQSGMRLLAMILCLFLLSQAKLEAGEGAIGNGGDGIRINGQLYLLDLAERGLEADPYYNPHTQVRAQVVTRLNAALDASKMPVAELAHKISEVMDTSGELGHTLLAAIEAYEWVFVNYELPNVPDEGSLRPEPLFQVAIRTSRFIMISQPLWDQLDAKNRAALVLHEMIFSLMIPEQTGADRHVQKSLRAREIVAYLHSARASQLGIEGLRRLGANYLPLGWDPVDPVFSVRGTVFLLKDSFFEVRIGTFGEEKSDFKISLTQPEASIQLACRTRHEEFYFDRYWQKRVLWDFDTYSNGMGVFDYLSWKEDYGTKPFTFATQRDDQSDAEVPGYPGWLKGTFVNGVNQRCADVLTKEVAHVKSITRRR